VQQISLQSKGIQRALAMSDSAPFTLFPGVAQKTYKWKKVLCMPVDRFRNICLALVAVAVLALTAPAAQAQTWVGSTGTVDPNSTNLVKYIDGRVELRNDAPVGATAFIRYNVLPVRDLVANVFSGETRSFAARFLDDGAGHVFLSLKQVNMLTGEVTTLMTLDSNASAPSPSYQEGFTNPGLGMFDFHFADSTAHDPADCVYYVEVQLSRTAAGGQAGLAGFSIKTNIP
jgi:hypothetical protein